MTVREMCERYRFPLWKLELTDEWSRDDCIIFAGILKEVLLDQASVEFNADISVFASREGVLMLAIIQRLTSQQYLIADGVLFFAPVRSMWVFLEVKSDKNTPETWNKALAFLRGFMQVHL